jgi:hypothetical protein
MPMRLDEGWNQIQFNLSDFTRRAYGTNYVETLRVQIHANVRIRRIYFSDKLYTEEELPAEFKLFVPVRESNENGVADGDKRKEALATDKSSKKSEQVVSPVGDTAPKKTKTKKNVAAPEKKAVQKKENENCPIKETDSETADDANLAESPYQKTEDEK